MTSALLACLIAGSASTSVLSLSIPDNPSDWAAAGVIVSPVMTLDPLDYGTPVYIEAVQHYFMGCKGFFVDTDHGEVWRIVLLFQDKLVVLEEGQEDREIPLPEKPLLAYFSVNGRYAVVYLGSQFLQALRVDLQDSRVSSLPLGNEVSECPETWIGAGGSVAILSDGAVTFFSEANANSGEIDLPSESLCGASVSPSLRRVYVVHESSNSYFLTAYTAAGSVLWETSIGDEPAAVHVFQDGQHVTVAQRHGVTILDGLTGSVLWSGLSGYSYVGDPVSSPNSEIQVLRILQEVEEHSVGGLAFINVADAPTVLWTGVFIEGRWTRCVPYCVNDAGYVLIAIPTEGREPPNLYWRDALVDPTGELIWVSGEYLGAGDPLLFGLNAGESASGLSYLPPALGSGVPRILTTDGQNLIVLTISNRSS